MPLALRLNDLLGHTIRATHSVASANTFVWLRHEEPAYCYHPGDGNVPPVTSSDMHANERNKAPDCNA
jgi:hypothetical protein